MDWLGFDTGYLYRVGVLLTILNPSHLCAEFNSLAVSGQDCLGWNLRKLLIYLYTYAVTAKSQFKEL